MAELNIPFDVKAVEFKKQVSWPAGDPGGAYEQLRAFDAVFTPGRMMITPPYQKAEGMLGPDPAIPAGKTGTLVFKTILRGGNGLESILSKLGRNCGLARAAGAAGVDTKVGGDVDTLIMETTPSPYAVGRGIFIYTNSTSYGIRFVSRNQPGVPATDATLDIQPALVTAPVAADPYYDLDTLTPATASLGEPEDYLAFKFVHGSGTNVVQYLCTGCAGTFKILTATANALPVLEWTFMVDTYTPTATAVTQDADLYDDGHPLLGDPCYINDLAAKVRSFAFDPALQLVPDEATSGDDGRQGWLYVNAGPPILEIELKHDLDWYTRWAAGDEVQFTFESIKNTAEAWAFHIPKLQILDPAPQEINRHLGLKPLWQINGAGKTTEDDQIPMWSLSVTGKGT